jgi:hypothetical protein
MQILEVVGNEPIRPTIVNHSRPIWCVEQAEARSMQAGQGEQLAVIGKPSAPVMPATPATRAGSRSATPISSAAG